LNAYLDKRVQLAHEGKLARTLSNSDIQNPSPWPAKIGSVLPNLLLNDVLHSSLGLAGRRTVIIKGQLTDGKPVAVKIYWPEKARISEVEIIKQAKEAAKGDPDIVHHLPEVIGYEDFGHCTENVRSALGLEDSSLNLWQPMVLRVIVFNYLGEITTLSGKDFIRAWLECVRCQCQICGVFIYEPPTNFVRPL